MLGEAVIGPAVVPVNDHGDSHRLFTCDEISLLFVCWQVFLTCDVEVRYSDSFLTYYCCRKLYLRSSLCCVACCCWQTVTDDCGEQVPRNRAVHDSC